LAKNETEQASPRTIIRSRSDAYGYIMGINRSGKAAEFKLVGAVALHLLETEVRGRLYTRAKNFGHSTQSVSSEAIDQCIRSDYSIDDLDKFMQQAVADLEIYTRNAHLTYSLKEVLQPEIIEKYLIPLSASKKSCGIPTSVLAGVGGNFLTIILIVLFALFSNIYINTIPASTLLR
jgi:hypothetical protein